MTQIYNNLAQIIKKNNDCQLKSLVLNGFGLNFYFYLLISLSYISLKISDESLLDDSFLDFVNLMGLKELFGLKCFKINMGFFNFSLIHKLLYFF